MAGIAPKKSLLIVEDDVFLAKAYELRFKKEGIKSNIVTNGDEAISLLAGEPPSVVILDILLPGRSGFEVLEIMRSTDGWMDIPVVVVSNLSRDVDVKRCFGLGATDYVVKADVGISDVVSITLKHLAHLH